MVERTKKKTNHQRKHPTPKEIRQAAAQKRKEEREKRTPAQQLVRLDAAFGVGVGANKERARLSKPVEKKEEIQTKQQVERK